MDQEQLIRQIMAEVMANLNGEQVSFAKKPAGAAVAGGAATIGRQHYPLAEKHPEMVTTNNGKPLSELTFAGLRSGALKPDDFRISSETLELQAQVADDSGRATLNPDMPGLLEWVQLRVEQFAPQVVWALGDTASTQTATAAEPTHRPEPAPANRQESH